MTQAVRQEPWVGMEDHQAHRRWHRSGEDSGNVHQAVRRFPWQRGDRSL